MNKISLQVFSFNNSTFIFASVSHLCSAPPLRSSLLPVGNAELDEVAPTFRELLAGSGVSFVQGCVSDVDLGEKEVTMVGATSDDLDGFMISDDADQGEEGRNGTGRGGMIGRSCLQAEAEKESNVRPRRVYRQQ